MKKTLISGFIYSRTCSFNQSTQ